MTGSDKYELSLIDYGLLTKGESNKGTFQSMCIYGCARFLYDIEKVDIRVILPLFRSTSTDYVGFFHVVVFLLNPTYRPFDIYIDILQLKDEKGVWHTLTNINKVLCLLCYVSGYSDNVCEDFLKNHPGIVDIIDNALQSDYTGNEFIEFTNKIHKHVKGTCQFMYRRMQFLYFIYSKIIVGYGVGYAPIIRKDEIISFLWELSCCFNFNFDLEQFNTNFDTIFTSMPIVPKQ
jgi:hypothetical protein